MKMYGTKLYFMVVENFLAGGPVRSPRPPNENCTGLAQIARLGPTM